MSLTICVNSATSASLLLTVGALCWRASANSRKCFRLMPPIPERGITNHADVESRRGFVIQGRLDLFSGGCEEESCARRLTRPASQKETERVLVRGGRRGWRGFPIALTAPNAALRKFTENRNCHPLYHGGRRGAGR